MRCAGGRCGGQPFGKPAATVPPGQQRRTGQGRCRVSGVLLAGVLARRGRPEATEAQVCWVQQQALELAGYRRANGSRTTPATLRIHPTLLRRLHAVGAVEYLDIHSWNISMRCPPEREAP
jgi:hypothetical protein